jgi:hypothetical protein
MYGTFTTLGLRDRTTGIVHQGYALKVTVIRKLVESSPWLATNHAFLSRKTLQSFSIFIELRLERAAG